MLNFLCYGLIVVVLDAAALNNYYEVVGLVDSSLNKTPPSDAVEVSINLEFRLVRLFEFLSIVSDGCRFLLIYERGALLLVISI